MKRRRKMNNNRGTENITVIRVCSQPCLGPHPSQGRPPSAAALVEPYYRRVEARSRGVGTAWGGSGGPKTRQERGEGEMISGREGRAP